MQKHHNRLPNQFEQRSLAQQVWKRFLRSKAAIAGGIVIILMVVVAILAPYLVDYDTQVTGINMAERLQSPSAKHLFGTDELGRDIFARVIYGSQYSLSVGFISVGLAYLIGVPLGAIAGYYAGVVENVIMRIADMFAAVPGMLLAIVVVAALGTNMFNLMIAIGIGLIPGLIRGTRAAVLTVRGQEYVEAAKAIGMPTWKIIASTILPNCLSTMIVGMTLAVGATILAASSLSFLGLGIQPPNPEWGAMLSSGRSMIRDYSYMTLFPGLAIMLTVLAFNLLGDGLRDALDPKTKRR